VGVPVAFLHGAKTRNSALSNSTLVSLEVSSLFSGNGAKIEDVLSPEFEKWAQAATAYFSQGAGLDPKFALQAARLYIALWAAGLNPRISRGWSDPAHQKALQARWDAGDRAGLRVRPATTSKHTVTTFSGARAATAIDMPCSNDEKAAAIAGNLKIGAGWTFKDRDPGHYYLIGG